MITFYSHDLVWDEEDNCLISFECIHLVGPGKIFTASQEKIKSIVISECKTIPFDSRCDYFFFGILFRLLVIVYPVLWTIEFQVEDSGYENEFIRGFNFIKKYRNEGLSQRLSQRWRSGTSQREFVDRLKLEFVVLNYV